MALDKMTKESRAAYWLEERRKRDELGMCIRCGVRPKLVRDDGVQLTSCYVCREKEKVRAKKNYEARKDARVCAMCRTPFEPGVDSSSAIHCQSCSDKSRRRKRMKERVRQARGLCRRCGQPTEKALRVHRTGSRSGVLCEEHAERQRELSRNYYRRKQAEAKALREEDRSGEG